MVGYRKRRPCGRLSSLKWWSVCVDQRAGALRRLVDFAIEGMQIFTAVNALHLEAREARIAFLAILGKRVDFHPDIWSEFLQQEHSGLAVEVALNQQAVAMHLGGSVVNTALGERGFEVLGKRVLVANRLRNVPDDEIGSRKQADCSGRLSGEDAAGALVSAVEDVSDEVVAHFCFASLDEDARTVVAHASGLFQNGLELLRFRYATFPIVPLSANPSIYGLFKGDWNYERVIMLWKSRWVVFLKY